MKVDFPKVPGPAVAGHKDRSDSPSGFAVPERTFVGTNALRPSLGDDLLERVLTAWAVLQDEAWRNAVFGPASAYARDPFDRRAGRPIVEALCAVRAMSSTACRAVTQPHLAVWQDLVQGGDGCFARKGTVATAPRRNALLDRLLGSSRTVQVKGCQPPFVPDFLGYVAALEHKPQALMFRHLGAVDLGELQRAWPAVTSLRVQSYGYKYEDARPVFETLFASAWAERLEELQGDFFAKFLVKDALPRARVFAHLTSVCLDLGESDDLLRLGSEVGRAMPKLQELRLKWKTEGAAAFLHDLLPHVPPLRLLELQLNATPSADDFSFLRAADVQTLQLDSLYLPELSQAARADIGRVHHLLLSPLDRCGAPQSLYSLGDRTATQPWWQAMADIVSGSDRLRDLTVYDCQWRFLPPTADFELERGVHPGWPLFRACFRQQLDAAPQFEALYYAPGARRGFRFT